MIIVEDRLKEIFDQLPTIKYSEDSEPYKPVFGYGNKLQLIQFIKESEVTGNSIYPLIWLLYPNKENQLIRLKKVECKDLTLILSVNTSKVMLNKQRMETTFKKVLIPLYNNVEKSLKTANIINLNPEVGFVKFPNFSGDLVDGVKESFTVDVWDALKTDWSLTINDVCLKQLKF